MSYARPQITTRIIPRTQELSIRAGLTVLVGAGDSGVTEYVTTLRQHPQQQRLVVISTAFCNKHIQRNILLKEAVDCAARGEIVFLEVVGVPTIESVLRAFEEAAISIQRLQSVLSMVITFDRTAGRTFTQVHTVEKNRLAIATNIRPFVGC